MKPRGAVVAVQKVPDIPNGTVYTVDKNSPEFPTGWDVSVRPDGAVKITAPEGVADGTQVRIPITVTYPDTTTEKVFVTATVRGGTTTAPTSSPNRAPSNNSKGDNSAPVSSPSQNVTPVVKSDQKVAPSAPSATQYVIPATGSVGPKLNTGGQSTTFISRVLSIFR